MKKIEKEIKDCPFCGGMAFLHRDYHITDRYTFAKVQCIRCKAMIERMAMTKKEAITESIEAWNTRKEDNE